MPYSVFIYSKPNILKVYGGTPQKLQNSASFTTIHQLSVFKRLNLKIVFAKVMINLFNKEQFSSHNLNQKFGLNHKADIAVTENPSYITLIEL